MYKDEKFDTDGFYDELEPEMVTNEITLVPSEVGLQIDGVRLIDGEEYAVPTQNDAETETKELLPSLTLFQTSLCLIFIDILLVVRFPLFSAVMIEILGGPILITVFPVSCWCMINYTVSLVILISTVTRMRFFQEDHYLGFQTPSRRFAAIMCIAWCILDGIFSLVCS